MIAWNRLANSYNDAEMMRWAGPQSVPTEPPSKPTPKPKEPRERPLVKPEGVKKALPKKKVEKQKRLAQRKKADTEKPLSKREMIGKIDKAIEDLPNPPEAQKIIDEHIPTVKERIKKLNVTVKKVKGQRTPKAKKIRADLKENKQTLKDLEQKYGTLRRGEGEVEFTTPSGAEYKILNSFEALDEFKNRIKKQTQIQFALKTIETPRSQRVSERQPQKEGIAPSATEETLPQDSPFSQQQYQLKKIRRKVHIREGVPKEFRVYEVSIHPKQLAKFKDKNAEINLNTIKKARAANVNTERVKDWQKIYKKAKLISKWSSSKKINKEGKLKNVPVVSLTKGCQRARVVVERVANGVLPKETRVEACYGGDCWVNTQFNRFFRTFENMEVRDLELADKTQINNWLGNSKNRDWLNGGDFIRMGQQGDDSHAIASGVALEWLKSAKEHGIKKKTVFISAGYAPITDAQYKELEPYKDLFEIHFSNAGWFHKNEVMIRLAEFQAAKDAGLNASIRIVTNEDKVAGLDMINQNFILKQMRKMGVQQNEILETPFHDDRTRHRSEPTGDFKYVCCENKICTKCLIKCMTQVDDRGSVSASFQLKAEPEYKPSKIEEDAEPQPIGRDSLEQSVQPLLDKWKNKPNVHVLSYTADLPKRQKQKLVRKNISPDARIAGLIDGNNVYLIASNLNTTEEGLITLWHEVIGHYGVDKVLPDGMLQEIYDSKKSEIGEANKLHGFNLATTEGRDLATKEYIAQQATENPDFICAKNCRRNQEVPP
jgi:hypothetical protein